jgi:hypothetical protein
MAIRMLLALLAATCSLPAMAAKPQIQWDPDYEFDGVQTFQWRDPPEASLARDEPFLHSRIVNAIEFHLTEHNLTEVESNPDVYVTYHSSTDTDVNLRSTSVGYGFGGYGTRGWGYYGYGFGGPVYTDTQVVEVERGALVIDIWDADSDELIWRGSASGITLSDNPERTQKNIVKAIDKMAKQYDKLRRREE